MAEKVKDSTVEMLSDEGVWHRGVLRARAGQAGNTVWDLAFDNGTILFGVSLGNPNLRFVKPHEAGDKRSREPEADEMMCEDAADAETKRSKDSDGGGADSSWNPALRWGD
mmetsp:Transcript_61030/g.144697  ORF Transcript_61030/g.144697 Transcript_61030/m.144697 type:complete len:111 (-) Transcript_61030:7-339(-)